jgi:hypothetical protein
MEARDHQLEVAYGMSNGMQGHKERNKKRKMNGIQKMTIDKMYDLL